ncbi:REP-associated tyrosine transposase [Desulfolithobacter sp.]
MSRSRYQFTESAMPHFLTCTVVEWLPVFTRQETVDILFESWRHLQQTQGLQLYGYVVLDNHLHAVARADNLPEVWMRFKSYTAHRTVAFLEQRDVTTFLQRMRQTSKAWREDRSLQFWQEGSHPQVIENEAMMRQKLEYIHYNPVKRGFVDDPTHWRWSSARSYHGMEGLVEVICDW